MTDASSGTQRWRRLGVAAGLSGAAHAAVIAFGHIDLPLEPGDLPPLAVRIAHAPAAVPDAAQQAIAPPPRRAPGIPVRREPAPAVLPGPAAEAEPAEAPEPTVVAEPPAAAVPEPVLVATAPASTYETPELPSLLPSFPRRGRISYSVVYGRDAFPVGRTEQSWQIDGTRYQLASRSETTGLADLFRSQHWNYSSRGELTPSGLRPETFVMNRNRGRGPEEARAQFDWATGSVTLGRSGAQRAQVLPPGSQDFVSFMYQLALSPPAQGRARVSVTNGTRLETYVLDVLPEERLETPLGVMRALPIRQFRIEGAESIDLWLAVEYRYLPVRVRFYGRTGEPTAEQIVTEIRLTD